MTYWKNEIISRIFETGVNFEEEVNYQYWWHGVETSTIACNLFQVNIKIYSIPYPNILTF